MSSNLDPTPDECVKEAGIHLIRESFAGEWNEDQLISDFDVNELFAGFDDSTNIDTPSTSKCDKDALNTEPQSSTNVLRRNRPKLVPNQFYCDYCEFFCPSIYNIKRHMIRRHLNVYSYACDKCNQTFKDSDTLSRHITQVHAPDQPSFPCSTCHKAFKRRFDKERHEKMVHEKEKEFLCPYCAASFTSASNCQRHAKNRCELRPLNRNLFQ